MSFKVDSLLAFNTLSARQIADTYVHVNEVSKDYPSLFCPYAEYDGADFMPFSLFQLISDIFVI